MKNKIKIVLSFSSLFFCIFFTRNVVYGKECDYCSANNGCQRVSYEVEGTECDYTKALNGIERTTDCSCPRTSGPYSNNDICDSSCKTSPGDDEEDKDSDGEDDKDTDSEDKNTTEEDKTFSAKVNKLIVGNVDPTDSLCQGTYENGILEGLPCNEPITSKESLITMIKNITTKFLLPLIGTLFIIMFIVGGLQYISSFGNETKMAAGKKTLTSAIIGLVIIILSYGIVQIFASFIGGGIG